MKVEDVNNSNEEMLISAEEVTPERDGPLALLDSDRLAEATPKVEMLDAELVRPTPNAEKLREMNSGVQGVKQEGPTNSSEMVSGNKKSTSSRWLNNKVDKHVAVGDCEVRREHSDQEQVVTEQFFEHLADEVKRLAGEIDVSGLNALELIGEFERVASDIEQVRAEVFGDVPVIFELIKGDAEAVNELSRVLHKGVELLKELLARKLALFTEVHKRARKNAVNYYFGSLLMAHVDADLERQKNALRRLRRILLSISRKNGWFHGDPGQWLGIIDEVLAKQCNKFVPLGRGGILRRMLENGFAVIHKAVRDRMIDEVRKLVLRKDEVSTGANGFFDRVPAAQNNPDYDLQRHDVIRLLQCAIPRAKASIAAILEIAAACLGDLELIEWQNGREAHAWIVKKLVEHRGVGERQARKDLKRFQNDPASEGVAQIRRELRALANMRIELREVERVRELPDVE